MSVKFEDLSVESLRGATVILDVDGTLVPDGEEALDKGVTEALKRLSSVAQVYLCSNTKTHERIQTLSETLGIRVVLSRYKKPNPAIVRELHDHGPAVVIGDKFLTDGLLAARTGSRFIKTKRLRSSPERFSVTLTYLLDFLIGEPLCFIVRLLKP